MDPRSDVIHADVIHADVIHADVIHTDVIHTDVSPDVIHAYVSPDVIHADVRPDVIHTDVIHTVQPTPQSYTCICPHRLYRGLYLIKQNLIAQLIMVAMRYKYSPMRRA